MQFSNFLAFLELTRITGLLVKEFLTLVYFPHMSLDLKTLLKYIGLLREDTDQL